MKPILFNTDMVRAILDGRKTVTRRVVKPQPEKSAYSPYNGVGGRVSFRIGERGCTDPYKPPYRPGDILYVRETWDNVPIVTSGKNGKLDGKYFYKADGDIRPEGFRRRWYPSIHMPREAARIFLRVTGVRVDRLQNMSIEDSLLEGVKLNAKACVAGERPLAPFARVWNSTVNPTDCALYGWEANPWVWVIEFERISRKEAFANA